MTKVGMLALGILMATTAGALAHSNAERLARQAVEIEEGRQEGSITWREGLKLRAEQREIARLKSKFMTDGYLTKSERRILHRLQTTAEMHIDNETSDGWRRLRWLPRVGR